MSPGPRTVFVDKDGTLIDDVPYSVDPGAIRLAAGAAEGARRLHAAGYALVVVTNQPGIARGLFDEAALGGVRARIGALLGAEGVPLAGFHYCPHHPDGAVARYRTRCGCRKPAPGLLEEAASASGADLAACWMIGDILDDVEAGRRAGCRTILVGTGGETEWRRGPSREPHHVAATLADAARIIVRADGVAP